MTKDQEQKLDEFLEAARRMFCNPRVARVNDCTQAEFNKLPGLVRAGVFIEWTGLSREELDTEVREGHLKAFKKPNGGQTLYYKHEIARMTGFKL
jgi:hypothetical protein